LSLLTYLHSCVLYSFIHSLTLDKHVSSLSHNIHFLHPCTVLYQAYLTESVAAILDASLVQFWLNYINSIMHEMSASNMHKLQSVQNSPTRVVLPSLRYLPVSE